jgi:hypothetical protein
LHYADANPDSKFARGLSNDSRMFSARF